MRRFLESVYSDSFNIGRYDLFQARDVVKVDDNWILLSSSKGDYNLVLPANECRHLVVYNWDDTLWCASTYPESCVYKFSL